MADTQASALLETLPSVLAEIESRQSRNNSYKELKEGVLKKMDQYLPLGASTSARNGIDVEAERMKDHISHFVLRLAFCKTEDLQRRFIRTETVLFRLRFETDDSMEREAFLRTLDLNWETVTPQEKATFKDELLAATPSLSVRDWDSEAFFKVPWTKVPDLVEKRKVFLRRGVAWVPMREQSSLVLAEFSSRLSKELEVSDEGEGELVLATKLTLVHCLSFRSSPHAPCPVLTKTTAYCHCSTTSHLDSLPVFLQTSQTHRLPWSMKTVRQLKLAQTW